MLRYILAGAILILWCGIIISYSWNPKYSYWTNISMGLFAILVLFIVYWVPFYLIFIK